MMILVEPGPLPQRIDSVSYTDDPDTFGSGHGMQVFEVPEGVPVCGGQLWTGTEAVNPPATFSELKAAKRAAAVAEYTARMAVGFPLGNGDTLQVRDSDKANWLTLKDVCDDAIAAGGGGQPCAMPPRTTNNAYVTGTYAETKALLQNLRSWGGAMMARLFVLKDAVDTAADQAALDAIDVTTGWP
jgi:hypothetical protein